MIGIRPQAGLANRMRSLDSAIKLAQDFNKELVIYWVKTPDFNCSFHELFERTDQYKIIESSSVFRDNGRAQYLLEVICSRIGFNTPFGYKRYIFHKEMVDFKMNGNIQEIFTKEEPVYIQTDTRFYREESDYAFFTPSNEIEEKISLFTKDALQRPYVGVHIRRSDNIQSILNSPTDLFVNYMQKEIAGNPDILFYLATDSPQEETYLKSLFPGRIITRKKELSRSNPIAIQDAWIDLLILSRAKNIYGSYYSSFSETAAAMNSIPFVQVKKSFS